jgi:hypothetical protein
MMEIERLKGIKAEEEREVERRNRAVRAKEELVL